MIRFIGILTPVLLLAAASVRADDPIRIGAVLPLTGDLASYGNLIRGGIEIAVDDLEAEGTEVVFTAEDAPLTGEKVVVALKKLIDADKVDGIAGNFSNVAMAAMAPVLERAKIPAFHTAAADPLILDSGDYAVTTNVRIKDEAEAMADLIFSKLQLKRTAVLSIQTNFGQAYRRFFVERFKALGGEIAADETFEISDSDVRAQLTRIRAAKPDALYLSCFGRFLGESIGEARELGIKVPAFSVYESEDSSVLAAAQGRAEGLRYFVTTSAQSSSEFARFRDRYLERYGVEPGTFAGNAYDAARILVEALRVCERDRECALKKIYEVRNYRGVSGTFSIERDGAVRKPFVLRRIHEDGFEDSPS